MRAPVVRAERDADGWNLGRLVKAQEREADREGPGRSITLESIDVRDGLVTIADRAPADGYRLPERIEGLDIRGAFRYEPVHYTIDIDHIGFRASRPEITLEALSGTIAVRDDNLYLDGLTIRLPDTALNIDGVIERYLSDRVIRLTTTGNVSLPEIGRVVPAAADYPLHPRLDVRAEGPADRLALDLDVQSEAGSVRGQVTADVQAPGFAVRGDVAVANLDLAPLLRDPAQRSDITGQAKLDVRMASEPDGAPAMDRLAGTFEFTGPRVVAAGYDARNVRATGSFDGPRINLDARAAAYGGTATARGFIVTPGDRRPLSFDLQGAADNVDLRGLPPATGAPRMATNLSVAHYRVQGAGDTISGSARLNASIVEGANLGTGTTAEFRVTPGAISYSARGQVADLDLQRIGRALEIAPLAEPGYASRLNGEFDVAGSLPRDERPAGRRAAADAPDTLSTMTLTANGTFRESELFGGRLPEMTFDATLDRGALVVAANGRFEQFDPARFVEREALAGQVTGTLDVNVSIADLAAPITPESVAAEGTVTLAASEVGDLRIDSASVQGRYANLTGEIATLELKGPDIAVEASGPIALDRHGQTALTYRVQVLDLERIGQFAGHEGLEGLEGIATAEGTVTGNAAELAIRGTLEGSNLSYQENGALELTSEFTVTLPELQAESMRVEATTEASFVRAGGMEINAIRATTTYAGRSCRLRRAPARAGTRAGRAWAGDPSPQSPGDSPARPRRPHAGGRVAQRPRHRGRRPVRWRADRD
jgi:hypothetical protein